MKLARRQSIGIWLGLSCLAAVGGCALQAPEPGGVIHVADIINSVKCGLAEAMLSEPGQRRLPGTVATVELQLKVVDTRSFSASTPSASAPAVFPWFGPVVLPNLAGSNQQSFAVDTIIDLTYRLDAPNVQACNAPGVDRQDKFGFARWLGDIIAGLASVSLQGPKGSLDKLTYDATFAVTREGTVGGSVKVVFLTAGANLSGGRADTQHLKIVISSPNGAVATTRDVSSGVVRAVPAKQLGPIPNLSSSPPAPR